MPIFYGAVAGMSTLIGIYLVLWKEKKVFNNIGFLLSFSSGVLLSFAIVHLMPEAYELSKNAFGVFLISILLFYILEHSITIHSFHVHKDEEQLAHPFGIVSIIGLAVHSLIDGVVIGAGFEVSNALGILAALSVILHEVPEGVSSVSILMHAGYDRRRAVVWSWVVALATPLGVMLTFIFAQFITQELLGVLLAFAAGSFMYVAGSDLIPEVHKKSHYLNIFFVLLGVIFPIIIGSVIKTN